MLIERRNIFNDPRSPLPEGKQGKSFEVFKTHQPHSIVDKKFVDVLGFEKHLYHGMVDYSFLISNDLFVSSVDNKNVTHKECVVDEYVGEVIINRQSQGLDMQDNELYKPFCLVDCGENVWMRFEAYEFLKTCMSNLQMIQMFGNLLTCKMPSSFDFDGGCLMLWSKGFRHNLHTHNFSLLHVPTMLTANKYSSQHEMVIVSPATPFNNQGPYDDERFFTSKWLDLRTSHFEEGGMMFSRMY
ncbi:hypothetical protein PVK06_017318 [Gossypium arboreum]|uniref:Uncharacterized protein n=1 Tax=Gossypium arboreum TaxID=29729 RepID=A0ABR0Q2V1_GOSAR|nr:hypothetical protein PVK06_017318 [Gossypium arboreum]